MIQRERRMNHTFRADLSLLKLPRSWSRRLPQPDRRLPGWPTKHEAVRADGHSDPLDANSTPHRGVARDLRATARPLADERRACGPGYGRGGRGGDDEPPRPSPMPMPIPVDGGLISVGGLGRGAMASVHRQSGQPREGLPTIGSASAAETHDIHVTRWAFSARSAW